MTDLKVGDFILIDIRWRGYDYEIIDGEYCARILEIEKVKGVNDSTRTYTYVRIHAFTPEEINWYPVSRVKKKITPEECEVIMFQETL